MDVEVEDAFVEGLLLVILALCARLLLLLLLDIDLLCCLGDAAPAVALVLRTGLPAPALVTDETDDDVLVLVLVITFPFAVRSEELVLVDNKYLSPGVGLFSTVAAVVRLRGLLLPPCMTLLLPLPVSSMLFKDPLPCRKNGDDEGTDPLAR